MYIASSFKGLLTLMSFQPHLMFFLGERKKQNVSAAFFLTVKVDGDQGCQAKKKNVITFVQ